jgi:hypothetical protein
MEMNRYQYGKIYKITSEHINKIYIGSTCKKLLSQRLASHNDKFKGWKKGKYPYVTSFELFELGSVQITLLEAYPCNTKDELLARERHYIELHREIIVNKNIPTRTDKEIKEKKNQYYKNNKEQMSEQHKQYYKNNKDNIKERRTQQITCECGRTITIQVKAKHEQSKKHLNFIKNKN